MSAIMLSIEDAFPGTDRLPTGTLLDAAGGASSPWADQPRGEVRARIRLPQFEPLDPPGTEEQLAINEVRQLLLQPTPHGGWHRPSGPRAICQRLGVRYWRVSRLAGVCESDSGRWVCIPDDERERVSDYAPDEKEEL